ncbi:outer membrane receptor protein involved in Fe transport [Pseudochelatococcus lubricantis]|uniref:Outer membrane receptor protein involved in Fe transport n=1 Tax=Pseudochelatococcus lubricantis TaxID=1538102 RepID=A0ABX0V5F9_9HYPH|nr:TonB-dependent receptor [Pseudochelatococcus lubricantis]NIJ59833.1 outer membrane receptor protein involved in Fe transport [Pseudochelatococcus lubricantis]
MGLNSFARYLLGSASIAALALLAAPALAQENDAGAVLELPEITVSGEKIERSLQRTASSVTVLTAKDIARKVGATSVTEAIQGVPNVVFPDSVSAPVIRGQDTQGPNSGAGAFFAGTVPRAPVNVDGHYLNFNEFYFGTTSVWDVRSIEVFRGPQTTSQGANATAGAIIVNTNDPTFTPEAAYQTEFGSYDTKRASFMLSGPLVKDELAARIALDYSGRDTFIDYINPGFVPGDTNLDFQNVNARLKLLWQPTTIPGLEAKFTYSYNSSNRPTQEAATRPFSDLNSNAATMPTWKQDTNIGILDVSYDFSNGFKFFNQTQYSNSTVHRVANVRGNGDADIDQWNASNEARITYGSTDDVLSGMAGFYYAHTQSDENLYVGGTSTFDDTKRNLGIFGELTYKLTDKWRLTGGLRYQQDQVERLGTTVYSRIPLDFDKTFSALLPKVSLSYDVTPDWTVGALVSRGYNPGGVALNLSSGRWLTFKDESLWNYELFTRTSILDGRLNLNGNLFYTDFKNAQYNIPVVISPGVFESYTINAEKAHSYGLEVGFDYRVLDSLTLRAGAGLLSTEIEEVSSNPDYAGNEFPKAPGYMFSLGASWDVTDKFNVSADLRHTGGSYSNVANSAEYKVKSYTIANAQASYQVHEHLQVYGYVRNVFDERAPTYLQQNRSVTGGIEASMTMPRTFGVGVKGAF